MPKSYTPSLSSTPSTGSLTPSSSPTGRRRRSRRTSRSPPRKERTPKRNTPSPARDQNPSPSSVQKPLKAGSRKRDDDSLTESTSSDSRRSRSMSAESIRRRIKDTTLSDPSIVQPSKDQRPERRQLTTPTVRVTGLSHNVNEEHLEYIFGEFGRIIELNLPRNTKNGRHSGYCTIEYQSLNDAEKAIETMNSGNIDGLTIHVNPATSSSHYSDPRPNPPPKASPPPFATGEVHRGRLPPRREPPPQTNSSRRKRKSRSPSPIHTRRRSDRRRRSYSYSSSRSPSRGRRPRRRSYSRTPSRRRRSFRRSYSYSSSSYSGSSGSSRSYSSRSYSRSFTPSWSPRRDRRRSRRS
ncbi:putative RNA recognition domain containing protein [Blattamonas nauphoetae]|uniref:RNA recognition domain containing protein n=1 Tax=Blattamonas nauphoetae TaxID=2049346 RepID=A0ABQ9YLA4_9EUKA|nr:putative RNA recognition domain containing protein [Blattamonas nauphoetae]